MDGRARIVRDSTLVGMSRAMKTADTEQRFSNAVLTICGFNSWTRKNMDEFWKLPDILEAVRMALSPPNGRPQLLRDLYAPTLFPEFKQIGKELVAEKAEEDLFEIYTPKYPDEISFLLQYDKLVHRALNLALKGAKRYR